MKPNIKIFNKVAGKAAFVTIIFFFVASVSLLTSCKKEEMPEQAAVESVSANQAKVQPMWNRINPERITATFGRFGKTIKADMLPTPTVPEVITVYPGIMPETLLVERAGVQARLPER